MLAELEMDSLSNNVEYVIFLTDNQTTAVNDLSKNAKEIYFLKLKSQNEIITKKIIIE